MSAFLGPIHIWLYNKIKFQDEIVKDIAKAVLTKEEEIELLSLMDERFGVLEEGNLADIIDQNNIHGWLQDRIKVVENHLAFLVTAVTREHSEKIREISDVAYKYGKEHAVKNELSVKEVYDYLDNILLNGMPCDRVNDVINVEENSVTWNQTVDIHEPYWESNNGNVEYYYEIRESLIIGTLYNSGMCYQKIGDWTFQINKEKKICMG